MVGKCTCIPVNTLPYLTFAMGALEEHVFLECLYLLCLRSRLKFKTRLDYMYGAWTGGLRGVSSPPEHDWSALGQGTELVPLRGKPSHSLPLFHFLLLNLCDLFHPKMKSFKGTFSSFILDQRFRHSDAVINKNVTRKSHFIKSKAREISLLNDQMSQRIIRMQEMTFVGPLFIRGANVAMKA